MVSIAAAQYDRFKRQVVTEGVVYTFTSEDEFLVFPVGGHEVIPFWSSRSRLLRVQTLHPKYLAYQHREMPIEEFIAWLPELGTQGLHVGVNWSGRRLVGYDVSASDLASGLEYWRARRAQGAPAAL